MTTASALKRPAAFGMGLAVVFCGATELATAGAGIDVEPPDDLGHAASASEQKGSKHWTLGAGVAARPHFQGSDGYQAEPVPLVDVELGRFFAKSGEGIGFDVIESPTFRAGVALNWMQGYDEDEAPDGLSEVKDALGARMFASLRFNGVVATLAGTKAITESERGLLVNASLAYPIHLTRRLTVLPSLGATWADDDYMVAYFGVDASEAATSRFAQYQPKGGLRDVSFRLSASYLITDKINVVAFAGVSHLLGDAADSPFVERQTQPLGLIGLTYTF